MDAILKLRALGYQVKLAPGDRIRYRLPDGLLEPAPSVVRPLIDELKAHKAEALAMLQSEAPPPKPVTYTRPDPDGGYIAWRWRVPEPIGRGEMEFDAVMALWNAEDELERTS